MGGNSDVQKGGHLKMSLTTNTLSDLSLGSTKEKETLKATKYSGEKLRKKMFGRGF